MKADLYTEISFEQRSLLKQWKRDDFFFNEILEAHHRSMINGYLENMTNNQLPAYGPIGREVLRYCRERWIEYTKLTKL